MNNKITGPEIFCIVGALIVTICGLIVVYFGFLIGGPTGHHF